MRFFEKMFGGDNKTTETKKPEKSEREIRIENFDRSARATIDRFWGDKAKNQNVDKLGAMTVNAEGTWETDEEKLDKETFESFSQVIRFVIINNPTAEIFDLVSQLYDKPKVADQMKLGIDLILHKPELFEDYAKHLPAMSGSELKRLKRFAEGFQTELINKNPTEEIPEATEIIEEIPEAPEMTEKEILEAQAVADEQAAIKENHDKHLQEALKTLKHNLSLSSEEKAEAIEAEKNKKRTERADNNKTEEKEVA